MKKLIEYNGIKFDSDDELMFYYYLEELQQLEYIDGFEYNTKSFTLSEPVIYKWTNKNKEKTSTLLREHSYTPDFLIHWNLKSKGIFYEVFCDSLYKGRFDTLPFVANFNGNPEDYTECPPKPPYKHISYVEIKPGGFDYQNMTRLAQLNIKWMYDKYALVINRISPTGKPNCLFAKTFVPEKSKYTPKKKQLKKFKYEVRTLQEFINGK